MNFELLKNLLSLNEIELDRGKKIGQLKYECLIEKIIVLKKIFEPKKNIRIG